MIGNYISGVGCELDISELKNIINNLDEGKNICDKDIILGLYYTFYTTIKKGFNLIYWNNYTNFRHTSSPFHKFHLKRLLISLSRTSQSSL